MTHLFAADEADGRMTANQLNRLDAVLTEIGAAGQLPDWLNVGNSAALVAGQAGQIATLAARHGMKPLLRPGLVLYGLIPQFDPEFEPPESEEPASLAAAHAQLQPVFEWKTRVFGLRSHPAARASPPH